MKLMALNLPRDLSENDLARLFKQYGNIKNVTIVMDKATGKSKGFGFVEMALAHEGAAALKNLHGTLVGQKTIRVKPAKDLEEESTT